MRRYEELLPAIKHADLRWGFQGWVLGGRRRRRWQLHRTLVHLLQLVIQGPHGLHDHRGPGVRQLRTILLKGLAHLLKRRKLLSCSQCQELGQKAWTLLLIGSLFSGSQSGARLALLRNAWHWLQIKSFHPCSSSFVSPNNSSSSELDGSFNIASRSNSPSTMSSLSACWWVPSWYVVQLPKSVQVGRQLKQ